MAIPEEYLQEAIPEVKRKLEGVDRGMPVCLTLEGGEIVSGYICGYAQAGSKPAEAIVYREHLPNRNVPLCAIRDLRAVEAAELDFS